MGVLSGIAAGERRARIEMLLGKVNLTGYEKKKVRALSGGMKRRLGIAQALLNDPAVLIVDEPTAGLDPEERIRFRNLLCDVAQERIVILSTHIVGDIEAACEKLAILDQGSILYCGTVSDLLDTARGKVFSRTVDKRDLPVLKKEYNVIGMHSQKDKTCIRFLSDRPSPDAESCEPNIEDAYMLYLWNHGAVAEPSGGEEACF